MSEGVREWHNWRGSDNLLGAQLREEVHLQCVGELRSRAEGEVHVLVKHLRNVRPRDLHPPRELRLRDAKLLHPQQYPPQKRRADRINSFHEWELELRVLSFELIPN